MKKPENPTDKQPHKTQVVWRNAAGEVVACVEKIKVLGENLNEIQQIAQDALEDAVLMGCSEQQFREVLHRLVDELINPYSENSE